MVNLFGTFFSLGPFGFRGPAAAGVPAHLTFPDGDVSTAQVLAPDYGCPSNLFLSHARRLCVDDLLYVTSANRSRHQTSAEDSPTHWRADGLAAEFGHEDGFLIVEHPTRRPPEAAIRTTCRCRRRSSASIGYSGNRETRDRS